MTHLTDDVAAAATPTLVQKVAAEAIGTFALVLLGCGVAVVTDGDIVATGLAFGLTVTVMAYAFGRVSGGHFNPAVSVGAALSGRISWREAGIYAGVQVLGGLLGAITLLILMLGIDRFEAFEFALGPNGFSHGPFDYAWWAAFLVELVMTFAFVLVILAVTDGRNAPVAALAPLAIGLTLAVIHFMLIPLTGTSVNPARSIGPALVSGGDWILQLWPFLIAPLLGGAAAGLLHPLVFGRDAEPVPGSGLNFGGGRSSNPGFTQQWNQQAGGSHAAYPAQEQPIIQDGWQWDPHAQQWIPAQQPAQQPPAPEAGSPGAHQGGWEPPPSEQTVVRPPQ